MVIKKKIIPHLPKKIGQYTILKNLGRGGMGEVLLAFDPVCNRNVALKRIRKDKMLLNGIQERFLKEARIASQLTHPSIIPIYSIHEEENPCFYIMSYIDGKTLKDILQTEKDCKANKQLSIHELSWIFLNICEAIAYTHERGILHRDLKPDNFMIGKFGEVMILDWGIAQTIEKSEKIPTTSEKIAGTINYLAPERAMLHPSTISTDIYALGAILYQILTLRPPFIRNSLTHFKKVFQKEKFLDPIEVAPYREIPQSLSEIAKKCLAYDPKKRYQSVKDLINDLKKTIEGKPQWTLFGQLSMKDKKDWEFQENIFLAKHIAITKSIDFLEWVNLMVSKQGFAGNIRLVTKVRFTSQDTGIGFLFSIPEADQRRSLEEGYHLWITPKVCQLYKNNVLVTQAGNYSNLKLNHFYAIKIEKNDHQVCLCIDDVSVLNYFSYLPLAGTHIGLMSKETSFELEEIKVLIGSHNVKVSCLAVPDAFLIHKQFDLALQEYRRIGKSFPGRAEGREALFRAALTLLEKAKHLKEGKEKKKNHQLALDEFSELHHSSGAPLEYLGKSLVYHTTKEYEEEAKCLELVCRKYPTHPLLPRIKEHLLYRIHESSHQNKEATFRLVFLTLRLFPEMLSTQESQNLLNELKKTTSQLYFMTNPENLKEQLSFWIGKKQPILEMLVNQKDNQRIFCLFFCLLELDFPYVLKKELPKFKDKLTHRTFSLFTTLIESSSYLEKINALLSMDRKDYDFPFYFYLMNKALDHREFEIVDSFITFQNFQKDIDQLRIWSLLLQNKFDLAEKIFQIYPQEILIKDFHFLYLCYLTATDQMEMVSKFLDQLEDTSHLVSTLLGRFLRKKKYPSIFSWEKKQLHRQLYLYYHCQKDEKKKNIYAKKILATC